jgi:hypothetical protein
MMSGPRETLDGRVLVPHDKNLDQFVKDSLAVPLMRDERFHYSKELTVEKVRLLNIWKVIGYSPKKFKYKFGVEVTEEVYVDRVIRHVARAAYVALQVAGEKPQEKDIYELALDEYFEKKEGIIGQVTRARVRLKRNAQGLTDNAWKNPGEQEYQKSIRALLNERRERVSVGG